MRTINLRTDSKTETIAARLQAQGYVPALKLYEHEGGIRLTMQWDRQDRIAGSWVGRSIWLTDDGLLAPEISVSGEVIEGTPTVDLETALAEIRGMVDSATAEEPA